MSTSSLYAEKTVYTSLTLFSDTKLNVEEWSRIYRQENPTVTGGGPGGPRYISRGRQAYKGAAHEIQLEHEKEDELVAVVVKVVHELDCMMVAKEIENELLEEVEISWNGSLSKTLLMKVRRIKKMEVVMKPKSKNVKVRVNTDESAVKPEPELKNTIGCNLNPSDGPGKPNSITMKTVKPNKPINQFQHMPERITKTKRSKNSQKPTKKREKDKDKSKSEESARIHKPDQPDTARKEVKDPN
ncbi:hypothetical protein Tco_0911365 [Tanacetum coccineum]|uniref:Uncharacterized protein n=1 Tax=Tanacetum coccineum TaxID=301880 RepID=A0ABQ5CWI7_9ASTR